MGRTVSSADGPDTLGRRLERLFQGPIDAARLNAAAHPAQARFATLCAALAGVFCLSRAALSRTIVKGSGECIKRFAFPTSLAGARWLAAGVALLVGAWLLAMLVASVARAPRWPILSALAWAVPVHVAAVLVPPFLSGDLIAYAVDGRVIHTYGGDPFAERALAMRPEDPYFTSLPPEWRHGTSAYSFGFHAICALVDRMTSTLTGALRAHQILAMLLVLATAAIVGLAVQRTGGRSDVMARIAGTDKSRAAWFATTLVVMSPTAVLEASISGHNDAWMMLSIAVAAWLLSSGQRLLAVLAVGTAVTIKLSGALPLMLVAGAVLAVMLRSRVQLGRRALLLICGAGLLCAVAGLWLFAPILSNSTSVLDQDSVEVTSTVRSPESLPRWLLERTGHMTWQFRLGLAVRVLSLLVLLGTVVRAHLSGRVLAWIGPGLYVFFAFAFARTYAWYFLLVLPLVPFCDRRWWRALVVGLAAYSFTWPFEQAFSCGGITTDFYHSVSIVQPLIALVPPLVLRWRDRALGEACAS